MRSALSLLSLLLVSPLLAQEAERRQAHATRVDTPPSIDGSVDEEVWFRAEALTGFVKADVVVALPEADWPADVHVAGDWTGLSQLVRGLAGLV